jgi:hypothetical protein
MKKLSEESALPLKFITVAQHLLPGAADLNIMCPLLTICRQLVPPWKTPAQLGRPDC